MSSAWRVLLGALAVLVLAGADGRPAIMFGVIGNGGERAVRWPVGTVTPTFDLDFSNGSGPSLLSSALTVDGTAMDVLLDCEARTISGTNWACNTGGTWAEGGTGSSPTSGKAAPFTDSARGVRGAASGKGYDAPSTSAGQVGTQDFAIEIVAQGSAGYSYGGTASTAGYEVVGTGTSVFRFNIAAGGGSTTIDSLGPGPGAWGHGLLFVDRSGNAQWYVNGFASGGAVSVAARSATLDDADTMRLLGRPGSAGQTLQDADMNLFRVWVCPSSTPNCFSTHLQPTLAAERFARLTGFHADIAAGSAVPLSSSARNSVAYTDIDRDDDGVRRLFLVGANWLRVAKRADANSVMRTGYISEPQVTNLMLQSQTFDNASWTKVNSAVQTEQTTAPNATTTADSIVGDATANPHDITQAVTTTGVTHTFSVFAKAGARSWVTLKNGGGGAAERTFGLDPCSIGTNTGGTHTPFVEDYGDGWCRVGYAWAPSAGSATYTIRAANSTSDGTFTGDATTDDIYVWGVQLEAFGWPSTYVATTTASASRVGDVLHYGDDANFSASQGTMEFSAFCEDGVSSVRQFYVSDASVNNVGFPGTFGGANFFVYTTAGVAQIDLGVYVASTLWGTGVFHTARGSWGANDGAYWLDGVADGTDASVTTWDTALATRIAILNNGAASSSSSNPCLGTRFRIWPSKVTP